MDAQELLLNEAELGQLARLWDDVSSFSDFMEMLRSRPHVMSGRCNVPEATNCSPASVDECLAHIVPLKAEGQS